MIILFSLFHLRPCHRQAYARWPHSQKGLLEAQYERPHEWLVFTFLKSRHEGLEPPGQGVRIIRPEQSLSTDLWQSQDRSEITPPEQ